MAFDNNTALTFVENEIPSSSGIVQNGLIGYWNSKQGIAGTTWADLKGINNMTIAGGTTADPLGTGLRYLDGSNDYLTFNNPFGNVPASSIPAYTIEMWLRIDNATDYPSILSTANFETEWYAFDDGFDRMVTFGDPSLSVEDFLDGVVKHLAITYSNGNAVLYINGVSVKTDSSSNHLFSDVPSVKLGSSDGYGFTEGIIDSVKIYNKALTQAEVSQNYSVGTEVGLGSEPQPVVHQVSGSSNSTTTVNASPIKIARILATTTSGVTTVSSSPIQKKFITGSTTAGATTVSGTTKTIMSASGLASGVSTITASLSGTQLVSGATDGSSTVSASPKLASSILASSVGTSSVNANPASVLSTSSTTSGVSDASANTEIIKSASGVANGTSSATGNATTGSFVTSNGVSSVDGNVIYVSFANASSDGASEASANPVKVHTTSGQSDSSSSTVGVATVIKSATGNADGESNVISFPTRTQIVSEAVSGTSDINAYPVYIASSSAVTEGVATVYGNPQSLIGNMFGFSNGTSSLIGNPSSGKPIVKRTRLNGSKNDRIELSGVKVERIKLSGVLKTRENLKGIL